MINIETVVTGPFEVNAYLVWGAERQAWLLDPGAEAHHLRAAVDRAGCTVAGILLTHGHADHTNALDELAREWKVPVHVHPEDAEWMFSPENSIAPYYLPPACPAAQRRKVAEGQQLSTADLCCTVLHTPGHTPGGVCYYFERENVLFTGDTLFRGSVGRTDLPGGNPRLLAAALKRLAALPDTVKIYPGHGLASTLEHEKRTNYFLRGGA